MPDCCTINRMMVLSGWFEFLPKAMWVEIEFWLDSPYDILFYFCRCHKSFSIYKKSEELERNSFLIIALRNQFDFFLEENN